MVRLALSLVCAASAMAQFNIYTVDSGGRETAVEGILDIGRTLTGETLDTRIRLRNPGSASVQLTALRVNGPGYSLEGHPTVPHLVAPGSNVDFRVRFQPAAFGVYSATLQANDRALVLRATAEQGVTVALDSGGAWREVDRATPVDFGRVERGQTLARRFALRNDGNAALTVARVEVSGTAFSVDPVGPLRLEPGDLRAFDIRFAPTRSGIIEGSLTVDSRVFRLQGVALEPPVPEARLQLAEGAAASGQQRTLQVRLAEISRTATTASLTLSFEPAAGLGDDPGVQFVRGSSRSAVLIIAEGDAVARWNGSGDVVFQTGTTAGTLVFRLQSGTRAYEERLPIAAAAPKIDSVRATRVSGSIEIAVSGFDNTRSASTATFAFFDTAGRAIGEPVRTPVGPEFASWFRQSGLGGVFLLRAQFPVTGDTSQIAGVEVELANSVGAAKSARAAF